MATQEEHDACNDATIVERIVDKVYDNLHNSLRQ